VIAARPWHREALRPEFRDYASKVVRNAAALAGALTAQGFRLVAGGTDNHLVLVDLRTFEAELTGKVAQEVLDRTGITCNRNAIPNDPRPPFVASGLRLGSAAETTAGLGEAEMPRLRRSLHGSARARGRERIGFGSRRGQRLCRRFDPYRVVSRRPGDGCPCHSRGHLRTGTGANRGIVLPTRWRQCEDWRSE